MRVLNSQWLDVLLAALLALCSLGIAALSSPATLLIDLPACAAAAAVGRWPRAGTTALILVMVGYLLIPPEAATLGEYAPLIPILTSGMRGQPRVRWVLSAVSVAVMAGEGLRSGSSLVKVIIGSLIWLALIAVLWLVGNGFTALRNAQAEASRAALLEQRLVIARGLHDTVARELGRAAMSAQLVKTESGASAELAETQLAINSALAELRHLLVLLRTSEEPQELGGAVTTDLEAALQAAQRGLTARGFQAAANLERPFEPLGPRAGELLLAGLAEAVANVERHAPPHSACTLLVSVTAAGADLTVLSQVNPMGVETRSTTGMGLLGLQERAELLGGSFSAGTRGAQWVVHLWLPKEDEAK